MTTPAIAICERMIALMKADSDFDAINLFAVGEVFRAPQSYYPLCEVFATDEAGGESASTGADSREITGVIRFSTTSQDALTVVDRVATVSSYTTVYGFIQATKDLFRTHSNETLNSLTFSNGGLLSYFRVDDVSEYGIGERQNTYENQTALVWRADVREPRLLT